MPLLHKKTFVRKRPPVGVSSSDKVFYCELTNEAFLDYDEYWERLVLCNAMVWTCEITGRPNLTYQEALDSEAKGIKFVASITPALKIPMLYLASLTRRGRQADVSEDVFNHCRDRYFPGECVEAIVNKHWYDCKVVRVIYPTAEEVALYEKQMADSDEECIADSVTPSSSGKNVPVDPLKLGEDGSESKPICLDDDEDSSPDSDIQVVALKSPTQSKHNTPVKAGSPVKKGLGDPPYATFKYEVEEELAWDYKTCRRHIVSWEQIRRSKNIFTREKCKLLLKVSTELTPEGFWQLKSNVSRKYSIKSRSYSDFFPGPAPIFEESRSKKLPLSLSPRGKDAHLRQQKKENKEAKLREKKEEKLNKSNNDDGVAKKRGRPSLSGEEKLSRKLERIKTKQTELNFNASNKPKPVISPEEAERNRLEQQKIIEQRQQHFAEMKEILRLRIEKEKAEKKQERDVKKEQRKLLALEMKDWLKPREDLMCGDHKDLPTPVPVACGVPNHLFGSFLSLLEFLNSFSEVLELHDVYPHGISFEMLENAIVTKEVAGVFNDVVQLLLGAVFSLQEEEDEEITADTTVDASASLTADAGENDQRAAAVKFANVASRWASQHHSTSLHQLPLDALTLTEVVRLHILSSGADNANAQWRHFNRGGYKHLDDPGLQFKLDEPQIVKDLSVKSIFDHHIEDKLKLLQLLMNQILTYASVRDRLEESFDKIREVKMALRDHQLSYKQMEREEHAARVLKKKESRQKKLKQPQGAPGSAPPAESEQPAEEEQEDEEERKEKEEKLEKVREKRKLEHSKKEAELLDQLLTLSAKTNPISLGEDRAHRRYWVFASVSGLFVEDDDPFPGTCYDVATKDVVDVRPEACGDTLARLQREAKQIVAPEENIEEKANTSDKENDTSALGSPQVNGSVENTNVNGSAENMNVNKSTENVKLNGATGNAKIAENVANTIARVILTPPPSVIANKLVKSTNTAIHNTPKSIQKSAKDRSITMFFSKSPKCSTPLMNGDVSPQDSTEEQLSVKADQDHLPSPATNLSNSEPEKVDDELVNEVAGEVKAEQPDAEVGVFGLCTANADTCPVHTLNTKRPKWSFFHKEEDIQALVDGLNDRGERESILKENILLYRSKIENNIKNCPLFILSPTDSDPDTIVRKSKRTGGKKGGDTDTNLNFPIGTPIDHILEVTLRDMILEVEEKLFVGVLGRLQVPDRALWRQCVVGEGDGKLDAKELTWGGKLRIAKFKASLGIETHSPSGSNNTSGDEVALSEEELKTSVVRQLAVAVLQVAQSVDVKYLKPPLAETEKDKKKRSKAENRLRKLVEKRDKEREEQQQQQQKLENGANNSDDSDSESEMGDSREINAIPDNSLRLPIERWELSLMSSVSFSQIFLHLATLDNSVTWSRSLTRTRCRICRKGGDHDKMLLCDGCDKGHHIYCLKPKLKSIPAGDWFCDKCKPKIKAKSPKKNRTIYVEEEEEEEEEEEAEEVKEEKEEEEEEECPNNNEGDQADNEQADEDEEEEEEDGGFEDDVCDSCLTGGTLICCDTCPRSFHQECVMLKKIPRGTWSCPECVATPGERSKRSKPDEKTSKKNDEQSKPKRTTESRKKVSIESCQRSSSRRSAPSSPGDDDTEVLPSKRRRLDRTPEVAVDAPVANGRGSKRSLPLDTDDLHPGVLHTLLSDITARDDAWPFLKPVNKKQVPDYYQVVKKPMDLQTMKEKLNSNKYSTDAQFLADGLLVFQNCQQYNMEDTDEFQAGANLSAFFKKRARQLGLDVIRAEEDDAPAKPKRTSAVKKKKHST